MSNEKVNLKIQQQKSWMVKETKVGGTKSQEKTKRNICIENDQQVKKLKTVDKPDNQCQIAVTIA